MSLQSISIVFEHCVLRVVVAYCVARQHGKNYQFSQLRNITGSKRRLDIPFPWQSVKLFTTNSWYATTTRNTQCSNATEIDCTHVFLKYRVEVFNNVRLWYCVSKVKVQVLEYCGLHNYCAVECHFAKQFHDPWLFHDAINTGLQNYYVTCTLLP